MGKKKLYEKTWFIIVMLLSVFPVGLFLMWKYSSWNKIAKIIVTILVALAVVGVFANPSDNSPDKATNKQVIQQEKSVENETKERIDKTKESKDESTEAAGDKVSSDKKKELKEKYDLSTCERVPNDVTGNWRIARITSAEANDPTLWAYDYVHEYWEKGVDVMWIVNFANHTTTSINVTEDGPDGMLTVTQHDYVEKEYMDAKELGKGTILGEWMIYHDENGKLVTEEINE